MPTRKTKEDEQQVIEQAQARAEQQQADNKPVVAGKMSMPKSQATDDTAINSENRGVSNTMQSGSSRTTSSNNSVSVSNQESSSTGESRREIDREAAEQAANKQIEQLNRDKGYIQDEQGNWVEPNMLDALKIRDNLRATREQQQKLNRWKQIESALYNSGAILSDMITAGLGGDVWKREKDTTAADAAKDTERLRELQAAEDVAWADKERQRREAEAKERQAIRDKEFERNTKTITTNSGSNTGTQQSVSSSNQTTNSTSRSSQNSHTIGSQDTKGGYYKDADGNLVFVRTGGRGGSVGKQHYIPIKFKHGKNGEQVINVEVDEEERNTLARNLADQIETAAKNGDQYAVDLVGKYKNKTTGSGASRVTSWDYNALIDDGELYQIPSVLNRYLDEAVKWGMTSSMKDKDGNYIPYTRTELYQLMTGDNALQNVPLGVILQTPTQQIGGAQGRLTNKRQNVR